MYGRLAAAIAAIGLTSMVMGYATFAYFSDSGESTDNTFDAGTLVLDGVVDATWGLSNIAPGDIIPGPGDWQGLTLVNSGSIGDASGHDLRLDVTGSLSGDVELADNLCVQIQYAGVSILNPDPGNECTVDGDAAGMILGYILSPTYEFNCSTLGEPGHPFSGDPGAGTEFRAKFEFLPGVGDDTGPPPVGDDTNHLQGKSVDMTVNFLLRQAAGDSLCD